MFLVKVQTVGTPAFDDDDRTLIGYDNVSEYVTLIGHEDDLEQFADGEVYRSAKIIAEVEHDDIMRMCEKSCAMQAGLADAEIPAHIG